ncbi:MAG: DUF2188 domain-containing protein [Oligoflexia bacterium]|nr:DUF2188 domain-containing protein [Oligoflexia bacterium]
MSKKNFHVVRSGSGWSVKRGGAKLSSHRTQKIAEMSAIQKARPTRSEVVIHGRDGKIRGKNSYGNDPYPPRG